MDAHEKDRLSSVLFEDGRELVNIKLFPGSNPELTDEQLRDAAADAIERALKQSHNRPPTTDRQKTTLDNFKSKM